MNPIPNEPIKGLHDDERSPWSVYRMLVLKELERLNATLERMASDFSEIKTEVALLKLKASVWGVVSGAISGAVITLGAILLRVTQ